MVSQRLNPLRLRLRGQVAVGIPTPLRFIPFHCVSGVPLLRLLSFQDATQTGRYPVASLQPLGRGSAPGVFDAPGTSFAEADWQTSLDVCIRLMWLDATQPMAAALDPAGLFDWRRQVWRA